MIGVSYFLSVSAGRVVTDKYDMNGGSIIFVFLVKGFVFFYIPLWKGGL